MLPMSFSGSSGPAVSGTGPTDSRQGFFTGDFTAATGNARATGSDSMLPLLLVAAVVFLLMRNKGR